MKKSTENIAIDFINALETKMPVWLFEFSTHLKGIDISFSHDKVEVFGETQDVDENIWKWEVIYRYDFDSPDCKDVFNLSANGLNVDEIYNFVCESVAKFVGIQEKMLFDIKRVLETFNN